MNSSVSIPQDKIAELCRRYSVRELLLFGSAIRDDFSLASDIDLIVDFLPEAKITFPELLRLQGEISSVVGRNVDLVSKAGLKPKFSDLVLPLAQQIYAV